MIDAENEAGEFGKVKGHSVITYDAREKKYKMWHYNNFGDTPYYEGDFKGDTLSFLAEIKSTEGSFKQSVIWYPEGKKVKFRAMNNMGKGFMPVFEGTATPYAINNRAGSKKVMP